MSRYEHLAHNVTARALVTIEHRNSALRDQAIGEYRRGRERGCAAFCAAVQGCYEADRDLLRQAWAVVAKRESAHTASRSPLVDLGPGVHPSMQERTVREDLHNLDLLRENHVLALGDDDLTVSQSEDQQQRFEAATEVEWHEARIETGAQGWDHGAWRLAEHRGGVETSSDDDRAYGERWDDALFVARKRRTHATPVDLDLPRDRLGMTEAERLIHDAYEADHHEAVAARIWEAVNAWTVDCEVGYRWDEEGVLVNDPGLEEFPLDAELVATAAPDLVIREDLVESVQLRATLDIDRVYGAPGWRPQAQLAPPAPREPRWTREKQDALFARAW